MLLEPLYKGQTPPWLGHPSVLAHLAMEYPRLWRHGLPGHLTTTTIPPLPGHNHVYHNGAFACLEAERRLAETCGATVGILQAPWFELGRPLSRSRAHLAGRSTVAGQLLAEGLLRLGRSQHLRARRWALEMRQRRRALTRTARMMGATEDELAGGENPLDAQTRSLFERVQMRLRGVPEAPAKRETQAQQQARMRKLIARLQEAQRKARQEEAAAAAAEAAAQQQQQQTAASVADAKKRREEEQAREDEAWVPDDQADEREEREESEWRREEAALRPVALLYGGVACPDETPLADAIRVGDVCRLAAGAQARPQNLWTAVLTHDALLALLVGPLARRFSAETLFQAAPTSLHMPLLAGVGLCFRVDKPEASFFFEPTSGPQADPRPARKDPKDPRLYLPEIFTTRVNNRTRFRVYTEESTMRSIKEISLAIPALTGFKWSPLVAPGSDLDQYVATCPSAQAPEWMGASPLDDAAAFVADSPTLPACLIAAAMGVHDGSEPPTRGEYTPVCGKVRPAFRQAVDVALAKRAARERKEAEAEAARIEERVQRYARRAKRKGASPAVPIVPRPAPPEPDQAGLDGLAGEEGVLAEEPREEEVVAELEGAPERPAHAPTEGPSTEQPSDVSGMPPWERVHFWLVTGLTGEVPEMADLSRLYPPTWEERRIRGDLMPPWAKRLAAECPGVRMETHYGGDFPHLTLQVSCTSCDREPISSVLSDAPSDQEEEDNGEELFNETMEQDYQPIAALDKYDEKGIDHRDDYEPIPVAERAEVDAILEARDKRRRANMERARAAQGEGADPGALARRMPEALLSSEDDDGDLPPPAAAVTERLRRARAAAQQPLSAAAAAAQGEKAASALALEEEEPEGVAQAAQGGAVGSMPIEEETEAIDLATVRGNVSEQLGLDVTRNEVRRQFRLMLATFCTEPGRPPHYVERIKEACAANAARLVVSYEHLNSFNPVLGVWVIDYPGEIFKILDEALLQEMLRHFPHYRAIHEEVHVRIADVPMEDKLCDLRQMHLNTLVKTSGVVVMRTNVMPQLKAVKFDCAQSVRPPPPVRRLTPRAGPHASRTAHAQMPRCPFRGFHPRGTCGFTCGPFAQTGTTEVKIDRCPNCEGTGPFTINMEQVTYPTPTRPAPVLVLPVRIPPCVRPPFHRDKTVYRNYQGITLQEAPGSLQPGRLPRRKEVILLGDLVDSCRPGEQIEVTGIYQHQFQSNLNRQMGFPVFSTVIEANHISKISNESAAFVLNDEDKKAIHALSKDPNIAERIFRSMAPSVYGHEDLKRAVALAMFGGCPKEKAGHTVRGDINVLMVGDPATAKSQILKYVEKTCHRVVRTTGKGASAVGLTAAVHKDPITQEWTLEGGALVLADNGICLIDEFDKMNDRDRTSIHEAMEQQTISISKAGIVTTLQARCSVIAAANPVAGRYDSALSFIQNVELTEPILSRFDIQCVVKDLVDVEQDARLAEFVTISHIRRCPIHPIRNVAPTPGGMAAAGRVDSHPEYDPQQDPPPMQAVLGQQQPRAAPAGADVPSTPPSTPAPAHRSAEGILTQLQSGRSDLGDPDAGGDVEVRVHVPPSPVPVAQATTHPPTQPPSHCISARIWPVDQELLKKYILYARLYCRPKILDLDVDKIVNLYTAIRQEAIATGGNVITVRFLESLLRIAEACAKMHLRAYVHQDDVNLAIRVLLESYIASQKYTIMGALRKQFSRFITYKRDSNDLLLYMLNDMCRAHTAHLQFERQFRLQQKRTRSGELAKRAPASGTQQQPQGDEEDQTHGPLVVEIPCEEFESRAEEHNVGVLQGFYGSPQFNRSGFVLVTNPGGRRSIKKTLAL
ncbi:putative DNA replication licensing factor MCM2 [Paratrimastix pyriformis]|uniref:DNA replication licensing factor MCM2 n=1 Tax=Paratrimastix pyriformis TaxID=342808 RepID=A0ABQ8UVI4_9EUKA|nr:putative DNA replication licensing factor MCM2 [Paratrimastix pyriformis]